MWPFRKRNQGANPSILSFRDGRAFFEMQCKYGDTRLEENKGVVALVLDAAKEFGTSVAVKTETDGRQIAALRVASEDGGFVVMASTPSKRGDPLHPGDAVIWVPSVYNEVVAKGFGDRRSGWVGFIRAKVAPEWDTQGDGFRFICSYD